MHCLYITAGGTLEAEFDVHSGIVLEGVAFVHF
jgi:hypothetical protein